jgi:hypothetical protein
MTGQNRSFFESSQTGNRRDLRCLPVSFFPDLDAGRKTLRRNFSNSALCTPFVANKSCAI